MTCPENCANYKEKIIGKHGISYCENYKPKEPEWKVGDWASTEDGEIVKIIGLYTGFANCSRIDNTLTGSIFLSPLRPLTPADWIREVDGVKVRAYEGDKEYKLILFYDMTKVELSNEYLVKANRAFCRLAGIPIMPYSLSKGKFENLE